MTMAIAVTRPGPMRGVWVDPDQVDRMEDHRARRTFIEMALGRLATIARAKANDPTAPVKPLPTGAVVIASREQWAKALLILNTDDGTAFRLDI